MKIKLGTFDQIKPINPDRLNDDLKAALGDKMLSMDSGVLQLGENGKPDKSKPAQIHLRLSEDATDEDKATADKIIADHKPDAKSAKEQQDADRAAAYTALLATDFPALREMTGKAQITAIIDALEHFQKLLQRPE